ncbi:hypothetical protein D3C78_1172970 [compost metagenome]
MLVIAHPLNLKLPCGIVASFNGLVQILRSMIEVFRLNLLGFLLCQVANALQRLPVILNEDGLALCIHPFICIDA